jgi:hypothetical protein
LIISLVFDWMRLVCCIGRIFVHSASEWCGCFGGNRAKLAFWCAAACARSDQNLLVIFSKLCHQFLEDVKEMLLFFFSKCG